MQPLSILDRFCLGSNKVLQVALGRSAEEEVQTHISELANRIQGSVGLIFTTLPQQEVHILCCFHPQLNLPQTRQFDHHRSDPAQPLSPLPPLHRYWTYATALRQRTTQGQALGRQKTFLCQLAHLKVHKDLCHTPWSLHCGSMGSQASSTRFVWCSSHVEL